MRFEFLLRRLGVLSVVSAALVFSASAQDYPTRTIEAIVPNAPGGSVDFAIRLLAEPMGRELGQPVAVLNQPGASTTLGSRNVAMSAPDGHTLLVTSVAFAASASKPDLPYDPIEDFAPITRLVSAPYILAVNPEQVPAENLEDLIAWIKAQPEGSVRYASTGVGGSTHLVAEALAGIAGIEMAMIPYTGGAIEGAVATAAGDTHLVFGSPPAIQWGLENGSLRAIAVTSPERWSGLPDVPTIDEQGFEGFEATNWTALFAPAGTPQAVIERIHAAVGAALEDPHVVEVLEQQHFQVDYSSPEVFRDYLEQDIARWAEVVEAGDIPL